MGVAYVYSKNINRNCSNCNQMDSELSSRKSHPELKQLKHVMRCDKTGLMTKWYDLGLELLDSNTSLLDSIKASNQNDADKCCTEMFKEWLACKPDASWDELITSLNNIKMNTAARNILEMISKDIQPSNVSSPQESKCEIIHDHHTRIETAMSAFISNPSQARTEFAIVLSHIERILQTNERQNLDTIKSICGYLPVSSSSDKMFSTEQLKEIDACSSIRDSFRQLRFHLRWDDHLILTAILDRLDSEECEELLGKYESKIDCQIKLEQIYKEYKEQKQDVPKGFSKMVAIVNKKYSCITKEEYEQLKCFISEYCGVEPYVLSPFVTMSPSSVFLEWMIPPTAVKHMVEMAIKNSKMFIKISFTFLRIAGITIFNKTNEESNQDKNNGALKKLLITQYRTIVTSVPLENLEATFSTLAKIFDNIIQHPNDDKYRQIKLTNKTFSSKVWRYPACEDLMKMSGWVVEDDHVRLRDDSHVHIACQLLKPWHLQGDAGKTQVSSLSSNVIRYPVDACEALFSAVFNGNISDIQSLLKPCNISTAGRVYSEDGSSMNLMYIAILFQMMNVAELLIKEYSVDPCVADDDGNTPVFNVLEIAPESFSINFIKLCVIKKSITATVSMGYTLLYYAVLTGCFDVVRFLIEECGARVNVMDDDGKGPLQVAYFTKQIHIAEYLIQHGADETAIDNAGFTPYEYINVPINNSTLCQTMQNSRKIHRVPGSAEFIYFVKLRNSGVKFLKAVTLTMEQFPLLTEDGPTQPHHMHDVDPTSFRREMDQYVKLSNQPMGLLMSDYTTSHFPIS